jgi:hypothetical protein
MSSTSQADSKEKEEKKAAPAEQEYFIQPTLARYIDRKDLEKLLLETFKKTIIAYVSSSRTTLVETTPGGSFMFSPQDYNGVFRYTASRELTPVRF